MEITTNVDQRYFSYANGGLLLPVREMILDTIEDVRGLDREQHTVIITEHGVEKPPEQLDDEWTTRLACSLVQNEWYKLQSALGNVPERIIFNHADRLAKYQEEVDRAKRRPAPEPKPAREPKAPREPKARVLKVVNQFTYEILSDNVKTNAKLAAALDMTNPVTSHDGIILQELERTGAALTLAELVEEVAATKRYETNDALDKSVRWHLKGLTEKGYVKATEVTP